MGISHIDGELVEDSNGKWLWRTATGDLILVESMADNHLRNAAMFLMGMGYAKCNASPIQCVAWLVVFRKEWERRMFQRAYEKKWDKHNANYDGQKELDDEAPLKQIK
jgi:hypothetical protein